MPSKLTALLACAALWAVGCAGPQVPKPSEDHPANPDASTAPLAAPSETLQIHDPVQVQQKKAMKSHMEHGGGMGQEEGSHE